jgi:hypothetical protein
VGVPVLVPHPTNLLGPAACRYLERCWQELLRKIQPKFTTASHCTLGSTNPAFAEKQPPLETSENRSINQSLALDHGECHPRFLDPTKLCAVTRPDPTRPDTTGSSGLALNSRDSSTHSLPAGAHPGLALHNVYHGCEACQVPACRDTAEAVPGYQVWHPVRFLTVARRS